MSSERHDLDYLNDILEAMERILAYTQDIVWESFSSDYKTQDAVMRNIEVIGEATKNLSEYVLEKYPQVSWKDMAGARDRLIHHYFGINDEIVWEIVQKDIPLLLPLIKGILEELEGE